MTEAVAGTHIQAAWPRTPPCAVSQDKLNHRTPSRKGSDSSQGRLAVEGPRGGLGAPAGRTADVPFLSVSPGQRIQEV